MSHPPTSVSLVLGSGGARGLAHIGVIDWLVGHGYEIRSVSGSSMGALVGGIHAAGKLDVYRTWATALRRVDVLRLLDLSFGSAGLFKGERVLAAIKDLIGEHLIEELPMSFTAVATDLQTGREVWIDRGPLFDAIRASIAIPAIFTPHVVGGRQLVDGGLVAPIPISPTLRDRTDLVVAVNTASPPRRPVRRARTPAAPKSPPEERSYRQRITEFVRELASDGRERPPDVSMFDVIARSLDTVQQAITRLQLAAHAPDVLVEVPRDACLVYEFHRAAELIEIGWEAAGEAMGDAPEKGV